jgi:hypothetical protein
MAQYLQEIGHDVWMVDAAALPSTHLDIVEPAQAYEYLKGRFRADEAFPAETWNTLRTVGQLRQFLTNKSRREQALQAAGEIEEIPEEWKKLKPKFLRMKLNKWCDEVWFSKMRSRGIELERCPDCNLTVRKGQHQCTTAASNVVEYHRGVPFRKVAKISQEGANIKVKKGKVLDVETMKKNQEEYMEQRKVEGEPIRNAKETLPAQQSYSAPSEGNQSREDIVMARNIWTGLPENERRDSATKKSRTEPQSVMLVDASMFRDLKDKVAELLRKSDIGQPPREERNPRVG